MNTYALIIAASLHRADREGHTMHPDTALRLDRARRDAAAAIQSRRATK